MPDCPSVSPGVYWNLCLLSQWCHPTILSSIFPFSSCPQFFPAAGSFPVSQLFTSGGQSIGASASVLPINIQGWFSPRLTGLISLQSKRLSRVFSSTTIKSINSVVLSLQIEGEKVEVVTDFLFLFSKITVRGDCSCEIRRWLPLCRKVMTNLDSQGLYSANKGPYSQGYGLPSGHIWSWELDHKEGRMPKNWCLWTVLEKTPESPLDSKEIKPVNLKGNQPWIFTGRTDTKAEIPILWPPDVKNQLIGKDPDAGKDWGQKEKRASEDEMAGRHQWCNEHELGQTLGDDEGQGGLA